LAFWRTWCILCSFCDRKRWCFEELEYFKWFMYSCKLSNWAKKSADDLRIITVELVTNENECIIRQMLLPIL